MEIIINQSVVIKEKGEGLRKYVLEKSIKSNIIPHKGDYLKDTFYIKFEHLSNSYLVNKVELEYDTEECYITLERVSIDINEDLTLDVIDNIIHKAMDYDWDIESFK